MLCFIVKMCCAIHTIGHFCSSETIIAVLFVFFVVYLFFCSSCTAFW